MLNIHYEEASPFMSEKGWSNYADKIKAIEK